MAKSNEIVADVNSQGASRSEEAQSRWNHLGTTQFVFGDSRRTLECESMSLGLCSGAPEQIKIEENVLVSEEVPNEQTVVEEPIPPNDDEKSVAFNFDPPTESSLVAKLRERIQKLETNLASMRHPTPEKSFGKSSELWCQLVASSERVKNLEQECAVLQKKVESAEARAAGAGYSPRKKPDSSERSGKSKKYLRKLEEAQKQISNLQAANEKWVKMQSSDAADFEELKAQSIGFATALQEQVKFNASLIVEKHRLDTELEEEKSTVDSLRRTIAGMEEDLLQTRRDISNLEGSLSALQENFRETCSELSEEERLNERLRQRLAETEENHKVEMEFLNSRLVQASELLTTIHDKIRSDKKRSKLVRIASRVMGLNKAAPSTTTIQEPTLAPGATEQ